MRSSASLASDQFESLLRRLPSGQDLDQPARQTKAIERKREVCSGADLLRLKNVLPRLQKWRRKGGNDLFR
jgi:hypothetical protein